METQTNWVQAAEACAVQHSDLASIHDTLELNVIACEFDSIGAPKDCHISANDATYSMELYILTLCFAHVEKS